jgi:hypothetical protein
MDCKAWAKFAYGRVAARHLLHLTIAWHNRHVQHGMGKVLVLRVASKLVALDDCEAHST